MSTAKKVTVYKHQTTDPNTGYPKTSQCKRTAENIEFIEGWIIEGTAETVDASLLDQFGRYYPPNNPRIV